MVSYFTVDSLTVYLSVTSVSYKSKAGNSGLCVYQLGSHACLVTDKSDDVTARLLGALPQDFSTRPCHVTVELTVDDSPHTCQKLTALLDHVQSKIANYDIEEGGIN